MNDATEFPGVLAEYRKARNLSQPKLAERAQSDHSTISRLEQGKRQPSRDMVDRLAEALALTGSEADALRLSAGFAPADPAAALDDPEVRAIHALLDDETIRPSYRQMVRSVLRSLIAGTPPALPAGYPEAV